MRTTHTLGLGALITAAALVAPAGASATPPTTVSGKFAGPVVYTNCDQAPPSPAIASGDWTATLNGPTAKATFDLWVDGTPHVAYKYPGMKVAPNSTTSHFVLYGKTLAGLLTVTVNGDVMEYAIAPYSYNGLTCDRVTFPGTVD